VPFGFFLEFNSLFPIMAESCNYCDKRNHMIIKTKNGKRFDTDRDLTAPERHILQKLFAWEAMADDVLQFRGKKKKALADGWNGSGPVSASPALKSICKDMEKKVAARLQKT
jgi:hypothetical protein